VKNPCRRSRKPTDSDYAISAMSPLRIEVPAPSLPPLGAMLSTRRGLRRRRVFDGDRSTCWSFERGVIYERYGHLFPEADTMAAAKLDALRFKASQAQRVH